MYNNNEVQKRLNFDDGSCGPIIYRQSPVKSPDIKNIIVVTLTFFSTLAKIHTTTAREPSIYSHYQIETVFLSPILKKCHIAFNNSRINTF